MARAGTKARGREATSVTRAKIVDAAIETLKEQGYAGASARAIAETGGFSQGLVFYHFGSVRGLLLAALDETSARRMAAYHDAMAGVGSLDELVAVAGRVYRQDLEEGHVKVLAELIAASSTEPDLGDELIDRIEPWIGLTEDTLRRVLEGTPLEGTLRLRSTAFAIVALYLGVELLTHLGDDRAEAEALFTDAARLAGLFGALLGGRDDRRA